MSERSGILHLDSWAGRTRTRVAVLRETPKRYEVRFEEDPGFGNYLGPKGSTRLVPKYAITFLPPCGCYPVGPVCREGKCSGRGRP